MADTWYFERNNPEHGELIVFRTPGDVDIFFVKRIVGLPGDHIEIRDDVLFRNGEAVDEPYIKLTAGGGKFAQNFGPLIVPDESYFLLGDNRHNARDSRYLGSIESELLHGCVEHRWFAYDGHILWKRFPQSFTMNVIE